MCGEASSDSCCHPEETIVFSKRKPCHLPKPLLHDERVLLTRTIVFHIRFSNIKRVPYAHYACSIVSIHFEFVAYNLCQVHGADFYQNFTKYVTTINSISFLFFCLFVNLLLLWTVYPNNLPVGN